MIKTSFFFDTPIKIVSIFDHIRFDRSDVELLSKEQREYIFHKARGDGFVWKSGRILKNKESRVEIVFPKQNILGANPIDILRYEKTSGDRVFVLTPTQAACYFLTLGEESFVQNTKRLLERMPINIKKVIDSLGRTTEASIFSKHLSQIQAWQDETLAKEEFIKKSHIGRAIF